MAAISQTTFSSAFSSMKKKLHNISLKYVPKGRIDNMAALVQIMTWRRRGIIWTNDGYFTDAYMRHTASMS